MLGDLDARAAVRRIEPVDPEQVQGGRLVGIKVAQARRRVRRDQARIGELREARQDDPLLAQPSRGPSQDRLVNDIAEEADELERARAGSRGPCGSGLHDRRRGTISSATIRTCSGSYR